MAFTGYAATDCARHQGDVDHPDGRQVHRSWTSTLMVLYEHGVRQVTANLGGPTPKFGDGARLPHWTSSSPPPDAARWSDTSEEIDSMAFDFRYEALPMRVRFGAGSLASLPEELDQIGLRRVLVLCSPGQQDTGELVTSALGERSVGLRADAVMHVPAHVAERAQAEAVSLGADGCVTVGGGSAIGLGKAIALKHGLPIVAVPTTYAGSEMTPVWGMTTDGRKETGRDPKGGAPGAVFSAPRQVSV